MFYICLAKIRLDVTCDCASWFSSSLNAPIVLFLDRNADIAEEHWKPDFMLLVKVATTKEPSCLMGWNRILADSLNQAKVSNSTTRFCHTSEDSFLCLVSRRQLKTRWSQSEKFRFVWCKQGSHCCRWPDNWKVSFLQVKETSELRPLKIQGCLGSFGWTRRGTIILARLPGFQRVKRWSQILTHFNCHWWSYGMIASSQSASADAACGQWQPRRGPSNNGAGFNHTAVPTQRAAAWTAFMRAGCDG